MIIALRKETPREERERLINWLESYGVRTHLSEGEYQTIIGLVGDTTRIDTDLISGLDIVESVTRISEPFKKANRKFHPDDTVISVAEGTAFGGGQFQFIAGPCSVESEDQMETVGRRLKRAAPAFCGAAPSSPGLLPMIFRGCTRKESAFCWRPNGGPACPSLRRLWISAICPCLKTWTSSRSGRGTCRILSC